MVCVVQFAVARPVETVVVVLVEIVAVGHVVVETVVEASGPCSLCLCVLWLVFVAIP